MDAGANIVSQNENGIDFRRQSIETALFGVLFTIAKEKLDSNKTFAYIRLIMEYGQTVAILLHTDFGWQINRQSWIWRRFDLIYADEFVIELGYKIATSVFYTLAGLFLFSLSLCAYVAYCFKTDTWQQIWPIRLLRGIIGVFLGVFYISSLTLFLTVVDCRKWLPVQQQELEPGTEQKCFQFPHLTHFIVGVVSSILFSVVALIITAANFEQKPLSYDLLACPNSGFTLLLHAFQTFLTVSAAVIQQNTQVRAVSMFLFTAFLTYKNVITQPYYVKYINGIQSGLNCSLAWLSACLIPISYFATPIQRQFTVIMFLGYPLSLIVGYLLSYAKQTYLSKKQYRLLNMFQKEIKITKKDIGCKDAYEFELLTRIIRDKVVDGVPNEQYVEFAENLILTGETMFPKQSYISILYGNFLIDVSKNVSEGQRRIEQSRRKDCSYIEKFMIFVRQQEGKQNRSRGGGEHSGDLISYVEFQRNFKAIQESHKEALLSIRTFWRTLLKEDVTIRNAILVFSNIDSAQHKAEKLYSTLLAKYHNSSKLMFSYARFLLEVKNDPKMYHEHYQQALKLETMEASNKVNVLTSNMEDSLDAYIIINKIGLIQVINKTALALWGYRREELINKSVNLLMPQPFKSKHDEYLQSNVKNHKREDFNRQLAVTALHKDQYVFPINISISKMQNQGSDPMYIAKCTFEADNEALLNNISKVYVIDDCYITSCDKLFLSHFGYDMDDLITKPFKHFCSNAVEFQEFYQKSVSVLEKKQKEDEEQKQEQLEAQKTATVSSPGALDGTTKRSSQVGGQLDPASATVDGTIKDSARSNPDNLSKVDAVESPRLTLQTMKENNQVRSINYGGSQLDISEQTFMAKVKHKYLPKAEDVSVKITRTFQANEVIYAVNLNLNNTNSVAVCVVEPNGIITYWNQQAAELTGLSNASVYRHNIIEFIKEPYDQLHQQLFKQQNVKQGEKTCVNGRTVAMNGPENETIYVALDVKCKKIQSASYYVICLYESTRKQYQNVGSALLSINSEGVIKNIHEEQWQCTTESETNSRTLQSFNSSIKRRHNEQTQNFFGFPLQIMQGQKLNNFVEQFRHAVEQGFQDEILLHFLSQNASNNTYRISVAQPSTQTVKSVHNTIGHGFGVKEGVVSVEQIWNNQQDFEYRVRLWSVDSLSGVLRATRRGRILSADEHACIILGRKSEQLVDTLLATLIKQHKSWDINSLFRLNKARGGIKTDSLTVGPIQPFEVAHGIDGEKLSCNFQAYRSTQSHGDEFTIVVRITIESSSSPVDSIINLLQNSGKPQEEEESDIPSEKSSISIKQTTWKEAEDVKEPAPAAEPEEPAQQGRTRIRIQGEPSDYLEPKVEDTDTKDEKRLGSAQLRINQWINQSEPFNPEPQEQGSVMSDKEMDLLDEKEPAVVEPTQTHGIKILFDDQQEDGKYDVAQKPLSAKDLAGSDQEASDTMSQSEGSTTSKQKQSKANKIKRAFNIQQSLKNLQSLKQYVIVYILVTIFTRTCFLIGNSIIAGRQKLHLEQLEHGSMAAVFLGGACTEAEMLALQEDSHNMVLLNQTRSLLTELQTTHYSIFFGLNANEHLFYETLLDLWNAPHIKIDYFVDNDTHIISSTYYGLWEAGSQFINTALAYLASVQYKWDHAHELLEKSHNLHLDIPLLESRHFRFMLHNGPYNLAKAYQLSLDYQLVTAYQEVVAFKSISLVLLVVEGIFVGLGSCAVVTYKIFHACRSHVQLVSVFLYVPKIFVQALATRQIKLEDDESSDSDEEENQPAVAQTGNEKSSSTDKNNKERVTQAARVETGWSGYAGQRALAVCWPFLFWVGLLLTTYFISILNSQTTVDPFTNIGFIGLILARVSYIRYLTLNFIVAQKADGDVVHALGQGGDKDTVKYLMEKADKQQYILLDLMLYGIAHEGPIHYVIEEGKESTKTSEITDYIAQTQATSDEIFTFSEKEAMVTIQQLIQSHHGCVYKSAYAKEIFFETKECLSASEDTCYNSTSEWYSVSRSGLYGLFKAYRESIAQLVFDDQHQSEFTLDHPDFKFIYKVGLDDILSGFKKVRDDFLQQAKLSIDSSSTISVSIFTMLILMAAVTYRTNYLNFHQALTTQKNRVVELLTLLPQNTNFKELAGYVFQLNKPKVFMGKRHSKVHNSDKKSARKRALSQPKIVHDEQAAKQ